MKNNEKRSIREWIVRILLLFIGVTIAHFGVTLFLLSDMGSDPFNVLVQGTYRALSSATGLGFLTHGRVHILLCAVIIVVLLFIDRSYIKLGTFICMVIGGPIIDIFTKILSPLFNSVPPIPVALALVVAGCVILAFGMTVVINSDAGTGPNDLVSVALADKLKKKFSIIRIITDVAFVLIGRLLGGTVGVGTLVCMFLVGLVAGVFLPVNKKLVDCAVRRFS
ncbi:MAG: hypothetical protein IKI49_02195 [Oscillospiraceae bacterium]|nr:hypothetical protein [Oscillospiraceae bacterium]